MKQRQCAAAIFIAFLVIFLGYYTLQFAAAAPTGATVTNISTVGKPNPPPGNLTDPKGTITTINISVVQQDMSWKAYVGNITGRLSLSNPAGQAIYDWATSAVSKTGEVYVSRFSSVDFDNVSCANQGNITNEHAYYNMSVNDTDNIKETFTYASHSAFRIGSQPIINANQCNSTATYINSTRQTMDGSQKFQEVVLQDSGSNLIYMTILSTASGYDNQAYDFQILVPESPISGGVERPAYTTYYFWSEIP
jgi:hypothetical protein